MRNPPGRKPPAPRHRETVLCVVAACAFLVGAVNILRLHEASASLLHAPQRGSAANEASKGSGASADAGRSESGCLALKASETHCAEEVKPSATNTSSSLQGSNKAQLLESPTGASSSTLRGSIYVPGRHDEAQHPDAFRTTAYVD